jgi:hypothetical protein
MEGRGVWKWVAVRDARCDRLLQIVVVVVAVLGSAW